jgi:uncharacterized protein (DUF4415 family)
MMKEEYDFSKARRGPVVKLPPGKTRITFRIDTDTFNWFREQVHKRGGGGGQTLMNEALRECVGSRERNVEKTVRKVIREELRALKKA